MSQELCKAAFCASLSEAAQAKLFSLPGVDWSYLWQFFLAHKGQAFSILEDALSLLPGGTVWVDLLKILESRVPTPKPTP